MSIQTQAVMSFVDSNNARIEQIIHIGGMLVDEYSWPSALEDLFMDDPDLAWEALGLQPIQDDDDKETVTEYLIDNRITGFLVEVSHPFPKFHGGNLNGYGFSWGMYATKWVYGETIEDCIAKADEWCKQFMERQRNKQSQEAS